MEAGFHGSANSVRFGDIITLYCETFEGWLTSGDQTVGWGLWLPRLKEKMLVPPRVRETRFQVVPKLYYSALKAFRKEKERLALQGSDDKRLLDGLKSSIEIEQNQNKAEFARLQGEEVVYGQTIQLLCKSSGEYVTVKKAMAKIESQCLKVDMDELGDEGSWFRVEPAFKFRSLGNRIAHGDSVRLISVKFEQSLHVSTRCFPFSKGYIEGVYEVNASQNATQFQVSPFATLAEPSSHEVLCGQVTSIYHSEINAYLAFDPLRPSKGPCWIPGAADRQGKKLSSNCLWVIESEVLEWGGGPVEATCGVKGGDRSKKRGYRLEHANSGLYLTLSPGSGDVVAKVSMSDAIVGEKTLWFFHSKNEGSEDDEGKPFPIDVNSASPLYMQHALGIWLSQAPLDGKLAEGLAAGTHLVTGRRDLSFTDSLSMVCVDQSAMTDISRILKHLKPLEFFVVEMRRREAACDMINVESPELRLMLGRINQKSGGGSGDGTSSKMGESIKDSFQNSMANLNPVNLAQSVNKSINHLSPDAESRPLSFCEELRNNIDGMRKQCRADKSRTVHRKLALLFWQLVRTRSRVLVARKHSEAQNVLSKRAELVGSLKDIQGWLLSHNGHSEQETWLQNTIMEQGALDQLNHFLAALVDVGLSIKEFQPKGKVRGIRDVMVCTCVFEIGQGIYDILRLACRGNTRNALALEKSVSLYDLHLGTRFNAASLLREIFKNRKIMNALGEADIRRYTILMSQHRKPAFVDLIRSLLTCEGKPVPLNQQRISRHLLVEHRKCLPEVKVVKGNSSTDARVFVKISREANESLPTPSRSFRMSMAQGWCDLGMFLNNFPELCEKDASQMDDKELSVAYFAEILLLVRDLCFGRCNEPLTLLGDIQQLGLEYEYVLDGMQSSMVPLEIRARLCEVMMCLHLDREPQQVKPVVRLVHSWHKSESRDQRPASFESDGSGVSANTFDDLKEATVLFLENCLTATWDSDKIEAHVTLMKYFCEIACKLCIFGFFTPANDSESSTADIQRLLHAALDNLSSGVLLGHGVAQNASSTSDVLVLLCRMLQFVLDVRLGLRTDRIIAEYKRCYEQRGVEDGVFWDANSIEKLHDLVCCSTISARLGGSFDGEFVETLLALTKISDVSLQAASFKLLMRQATPMVELVEMVRRVELLENQDAVSCYEKLCKSTNVIRGRLSDISKDRSDAFLEVSENLHLLMELTNRAKYGDHLVTESQKFMRLNQCHLHVFEILRIPLEVTHIPLKLDQPSNPLMHKLFADCYEFLQCFCHRDQENQTEIFDQMSVMFEHLSVDGLNAAECLVAVIRDNMALCSKINEKVLRRFMTAIVKFGKFGRWLRFMLVCIAVDEVPIKRNQDLVLRLLEEEADILMEIDGNQGGGEGDAANVLSREGNATRFQLLMQREHVQKDSFVEYHVMCIELLAKCAEGLKNQANKEKCQSLLSFDQVLESILDLHLIDRPEGNTRKLPSDSLHFVRSGFVQFLRHVYLTKTDTKTLKRISEEGNRWYACPALLVEKWRYQDGIMDHFIDEIETLRKSFVSNRNVVLKFREIAISSINTGALDIAPIEYHWSYIFYAVIPCLNDYYAYQSGFTISVNGRYAEYCRQYAGQIAHTLSSLLEVVDLNPSEAEACLRLYQQLESIGVSAKFDKVMLTLQNSCRRAVSGVQIKMKSYWTRFVHELGQTLGVGRTQAESGPRTRGLSQLLAESAEDYLPQLMNVLTESLQSPEIVDSKFVEDLLRALRGSIHISVSTPESVEANWELYLKDRPPASTSVQGVALRYLKSGVLQTAMLLISHPSDDVVLVAVRLAWLILTTFRKDAQAFAVEVLETEMGSNILDSCRQGIKKFLDKLKADKKQRRKSIVAEEDSFKNLSSANRACELLQMIELLCKGNKKVQSSLRKHHVLSTLVDVMEEIERNILSAVTGKDVVTAFTLTKAFNVLSAALEGPNNQNRLALTNTNILLMINRVLGTLSYNSADAIQNILKASIRSSCVQLLLELLQSPSDPIVSKRVLETVDWDQFFRCLKEASDLIQTQMGLWNMDVSDFLLTVHFRQAESMHEFFDRIDLQSPYLCMGFVLNVSDDMRTVNADEEGKEMVKRALIDVLFEGFMMANIARVALEDSIVFAGASSMAKRQDEIKKFFSKEDFSLFMSRIFSVEIERDGVLERLYFRLPEACVRLQKDKAFLQRVENALFKDLDIEGEEDRRESLLERMTALSDQLQSEFELSNGPYRWVVDYEASLESYPKWAAVAINLVFVLGFEEHGPGALVCTSSWFIDFGTWGKPFFHIVPWVMLLIALFHLVSSAARLASNVVQCVVHAEVEARRETLSFRDDPGETSQPVTVATELNDRAMYMSMLKSLTTDREVVFTAVFLLSSLMGFFWSPFFYAIPLTDLLRSPTVLLLLKSVQHNANKLGQGALVGLLLVYGHAIVGYGFFQENHQEGKCENLFGCSVTYMISGIKGDSIESALEDLATPGALWSHPSMWARMALDMSFHIIIPLILLSIISGIIIDGFGELRDDENKAKEFRENTSMICGVDRNSMEQVCLGSFDRHVTEEQNPSHYVFLLRKLELQPVEADTDQESHVRGLVNQGSTGFFPTKAICMQLRHLDTSGDDLKTIAELLKAMEIRLRTIEREMRWQSRRSAPTVVEDAEAAPEEEGDKKEFWQSLNPLDMKLGALNPLDMRVPNPLDLKLPTIKMLNPLDIKMPSFDLSLAKGSKPAPAAAASPAPLADLRGKGADGAARSAFARPADQTSRGGAAARRDCRQQ